MEKPTVFFSHSSRDTGYLSLLKRKILEKTANTIEVFLSSDGESIPFGNNWVHKIEENLNKAKIMLVFVSGNSLKSSWIYFESGFSYSKGVKVIPVGILGVDIGKLPPPISLLQGFNISSFDGLNNILAVINREHGTTFPEDFDIDDFNALVGSVEITPQRNEAEGYVDFIQMELVPNLESNKLVPNLEKIVAKNLETRGVDFSFGQQGAICLNGMIIKKRTTGKPDSERFEILIDLFNLSKSIEVVNGFISEVYENPLKKYWLNICFEPGVDIVSTDFKLSSRLSNIGISMSKDNGNVYEFGNISFLVSEGLIDNISNRKHLRIIFSPENFDIGQVFALIERLVRSSIINRVDRNLFPA